MRQRFAPYLWVLLCTLAACSPALNWRAVQLGHLSTLLPCKPDSATRQVSLAGISLAMEMSGCEVEGALFAISRIQAADVVQAQALMAELRKSGLAQVQARAVHPAANSGDAQTSFDVSVDGKRADGQTLQARFKWQVFGSELYQIAAYAEHLGPEQIDSLVGEARIR